MITPSGKFLVSEGIKIICFFSRLLGWFPFGEAQDLLCGLFPLIFIRSFYRILFSQ